MQAEYLRALVDSSTAASELRSHIDPQLFESICVFTLRFFRDSFLRDGDGDFAPALAEYLTSGLEIAISSNDVRQWRGKTTEAGEVLAARLAEPGDPFSSSEEVLLALPHNPRAPASVDDITSLVAGYHEAVLAADRTGDDQFLVTLAEYGRRYEVVVEVEVPLLEPSRVKIEEDLPLRLKRRGLRPWIAHELPLGDSRSTHLEARSDDPSIEVTGYEIQDLNGNDASGWLESILLTGETVSLYGSERGRPYFAILWLRLGVARPLVVAAALLLTVNLVAIAAVPFIGFDGAAGGGLAALAIPATIAATFALVREQTALAMRLQWIPRLLLAVTTLALWLEVVAGLIVADDGKSQASIGRPTQPAKWSESTVGRSNMSHGKDLSQWPRMQQRAAAGSVP